MSPSIIGSGWALVRGQRSDLLLEPSHNMGCQCICIILRAHIDTHTHTHTHKHTLKQTRIHTQLNYSDIQVTGTGDMLIRQPGVIYSDVAPH